MRHFLFLLSFISCSLLTAQVVASVDHGPALTYQSSATDSNGVEGADGADEGINISIKRNKRERTLLGDLDLTGLWFGPTYKYASTGDDLALMRGGFGGLEFSEELFIGYGSWKSREDFTVKEPGANSPIYDFNHSGLIIAYAPFADNAIHPRISATFGPGRFELKDDDSIDVDDRSDRFLMGQATIGLELNLFQWFRLGIDGGYRFASGVENDFVSANDLGGAIVQLEARFGLSW